MDVRTIQIEQTRGGSRKRIQNSSSATTDQTPMNSRSNQLVCDRQEAVRCSDAGGSSTAMASSSASSRSIEMLPSVYSFTAPKVRPATMCRCTTEKMISAGISVKIEIAAMVPHSVPVVVTYSDRPVVMRAGVEAGQRRGEQELVPGEHPGQDQRDREAGPASGKIDLA